MYQKPEMNVEQFEVEDVLTTSGVVPEPPTDPETTLDNFETNMIVGFI